MTVVETIEARQEAISILLDVWLQHRNRQSNPIADVVWNAAQHLRKQQDGDISLLKNE